MPETLPNPFYGPSPIGEALRNLSSTIMSGPTEAQRILQAEQALKAQTQRLDTTSLGSVVQQLGQPGFDRAAANRLMVTSGYDPKRFSEIERSNAANVFGAADPRTTNAVVGAGGDFGHTAQGVGQAQALDLYKFNQTPQVYGTNAGPVIGTRQTAIGQPAVEELSKVQGNAARVAMNTPGGISAQPPAVQRFIHADAKDQITHNYVAPGGQVIQTRDGLTAAATGAPLPQGGYIAQAQGDITGLGIKPSVQAHLQQQQISMDAFKRIGDYADQFISPTTVGIPGMLKGVTQNAAATVTNIAKGLGADSPAQWLETAKQRAIQSGANPDVVSRLMSFDPNLPKLETAYHMLSLSGAEAMAGGMRNVSDRDMRIIQHTLGSPEALFASPESLRAKMQAVQDIIGIRHDVNNQNLRPGITTPAPPAPGGVVAPPPSPSPGAPQLPASMAPLATQAQPGSFPQAAPVEQWERGPDGKLMRVQ